MTATTITTDDGDEIRIDTISVITIDDAIAEISLAHLRDILATIIVDTQPR